MALIDQNNLEHQVVIEGKTDVFHLLRASFNEKINGGFIVEIEAVSDDPQIDLERLIGTSALVHLGRHDAHGGVEKSIRILHGVILEARWPGTHDNLETGKQYMYEFLLGPFLELAKRRTDSKVFESQTPADIIRNVALPHAGSHGQIKVLDSAGSAPTFDHFMQYRESDFDFMHRIAQRYGINMLFQMQEAGHDLVLYSENASVGGNVTKVDASGAPNEILSDFQKRQTFRVSAVETSDYDQFKPNAMQTINADDIPQYGSTNWSEFNYPGGYQDGLDPAKIAERRLHALRAESEGLSAVCHSIEVAVGQRFQLSDHPSDWVNGAYVVTEYSLTVTNFTEGGREFGTSARVVMVPDEIPIAPSRTIVEPQIPGIVTAKVTAGSEKDPKKMGRLKVKYPFVRENESFWCRVAQSWAGGGLGTWVNHRVGHEVIVAFEHGDINRPIVMGSLYNGINGNPYIDELADEVSGWKSQSPDGHNEIYFRDKGGDELVRIHAQKNMQTAVLADKSTTVGNDLSKEVDGNSSWHTKGTNNIDTDGVMTFQSPTKIVLECGGSTITMTPDAIELSSTSIRSTALKEIMETAGLVIAETAGTDVTVTAGARFMSTAGSEIGLSSKKIASSGSEEVLVDAGKKYALSAGEDADFTAGKDVKVTGDKKVDLVSKGNVTVKGKKVEMN